MPTPWLLSWRMMRKRSSISALFSAAVGSSMMSTLESNDSALAISTICCLATVSSPTDGVRVERQIQAVEAASGGLPVQLVRRR